MVPLVVANPQVAPAEAAHTYAALDLGSNSFHLIVARHCPPAASAAGAVDGSRLQVVDRHRETVRLADGLNESNEITAAAAARALACLGRLGQRIRHLPGPQVRVVGTNTLRKASNSRAFIGQAERVLGHRVEVVSGREEARLIYLGVSHSLETVDAGESRLVVDIGGGSTELILGARFQPRLMESLYMGCVSMSAAFFPNGRITDDRMAAAENAARQELEAVEQIYRARGWDMAIGASGTLNAVHDAIAQRTGRRGINPAGVESLKCHLIRAGNAEAIALDAVDADRAPVFAGGLAITAALFGALGIENMAVSDGALREGLLHDLLGRVHAEDIRETTVADLMRRYHVDADHAGRVAATAQGLFEQLSWPDLAVATTGWPNGEDAATGTPLEVENAARLLRWGAMLHEIGMDIAHSQYHKHGGYLLDNMDLPGFSRSEQHDLATLVRSHRRKLPVVDGAVSPGLPVLCVLLRLAVVLHRGRLASPPPALGLRRDGARKNHAGGTFTLVLPGRWVGEHPLTKLDLQQEADYLAAGGVKLRFVTG